MNAFGTIYRLTTSGESHGPAIGGVIDGVPAGLAIDLAEVQKQLARRRPGQSVLTTARNEADPATPQARRQLQSTTAAKAAIRIRRGPAKGAAPS